MNAFRPTRHRRRDRGLLASLVAVVLALVVALAGALVSLAPTDPARRDAAAGPVTDRTELTTTPATGPAVTGETPPAAAGDPPRRARTMSMDAPIQGGFTAHQAQAVSARLLAAHREPGSAEAGATWTPAMGETAVARARSWLGMPYSWAGGAATGPTAGRCDKGNGADLDCRIVGFDCSGLMMYAWGPYAGLPHFAQTQREAGEFHPTRAQLRPGDLVFFSGYLDGGIGHVAIYEGHGTVIEAPQSGQVVRRSPLAELMANDGVYRGAVRPLTTATPALARPDVRVPRRGGPITLRGTQLDGVTAVTVGRHVVREFLRRTGSAITLRVPADPVGRPVAVTVTTSWGATSDPVRLAYAPARRPAEPKRPRPTPSPTKPTPSPTKPTPTIPTPTKPTPSPTKPTPTKPTPSPTKPTPSRSSSSTPTVAATPTLP